MNRGFIRTQWWWWWWWWWWKKGSGTQKWQNRKGFDIQYVRVWHWCVFQDGSCCHYSKIQIICTNCL